MSLINQSPSSCKIYNISKIKWELNHQKKKKEETEFVTKHKTNPRILKGWKLRNKNKKYLGQNIIMRS